MQLKLTNTITRKKEPIAPLIPGEIKLYVCGITPYDYAHIGHGRVYVAFDVLLRWLKFLEYKVTYARNFTDIDDKLINKAIAEKNDPMFFKIIANLYIDSYHKDMKSLNCLSPDYEPRVTECIPEIIAFVENLIKKTHAYVIGSDVYFDISTFDHYGKLSGRKLDDMEAGARIMVNTDKKNPGDFALWKGNDKGLFWQSPWGHGRPGWHIECSVMAKKYLGETIDIHGGGQDLIFPHHENEIAQSESCHNKQFANVWMHNAFVNINKEKMSKSLGNFVTLQQLFKVVDPMVLRFFYLQHHYKSPIDFSDQELEASQTAYKKLVNHLGQKASENKTMKDYESFIATNSIAQDMCQALCDDLNTPKFLGVVFQHLSELKNNAKLADFTRILIQQILGLTLEHIMEEEPIVTSEIKELLKKRELARADKNWTLADQIRDELTSKGYSIQDKKT